MKILNMFNPSFSSANPRRPSPPLAAPRHPEVQWWWPPRQAAAGCKGRPDSRLFPPLTTLLIRGYEGTEGKIWKKYDNKAWKGRMDVRGLTNDWMQCTTKLMKLNVQFRTASLVTLAPDALVTSLGHDMKPSSVSDDVAAINYKCMPPILERHTSPIQQPLLNWVYFVSPCYLNIDLNK